MKKLRILALAEVFSPDLLAGAGTVLYHEAREFVKQGHEVHVLVRRARPDLPNRETIDGIHVHRYGSRMTGPLRHLATALKGYAELRRLMRDEAWNILYVHQPYSGLLLALASPGKVPVAYRFHSSWHQEFLVNRRKAGPGLSPGYYLRQGLERKALGICQTIIPLSDFSVEILRDAHGMEKGITKIPGGVDVERFLPAQSREEARKALGLPCDRFILFTLRNLRERMGLFNLLGAAALVKERVPGALFVLGGRGPLRDQLGETICSKSLEDAVQMVGEVPDEKLPLYYRAADAFVLPTEQLEGFGLISLESFASGIPVVATPVGANKEVVGNSPAGFLSASTSGADLAEVIVRLHGMDVSQKPSIEAARGYAMDFSWERVGERLLEEFEGLSGPGEGTHTQ